MKQTALTTVGDEALVQLRAAIESELRRRKLAFSVGDVGEKVVLAHFNSTPGLPKLLLAPKGTKNVDALSRDGDRYSIKTVWNAKKTSTIYPDPHDKDKQLFEYILIAKLNDDWSLHSIHQFTWREFTTLRSWDSRMNAWYVPITVRCLGSAKMVFGEQSKKVSPPLPGQVEEPRS